MQQLQNTWSIEAAKHLIMKKESSGAGATTHENQELLEPESRT